MRSGTRRAISTNVRLQSNVRCCGYLRSEQVQQDGASPQTAENNPEILNSARVRRGRIVEIGTQPSQSPDFNINDLSFFASFKPRVCGMNSVEEVVKVGLFIKDTPLSHSVGAD